jgi:transcription termination/antitermination protein NusG
MSVHFSASRMNDPAYADFIDFVMDHSAEQQDPQNWYATYTNPRHEKLVAQQLNARDIECFLPLYKSVRRWKDRRKQLELPLFPGYVFIRISLRERLRVLNLPGVIHIVTFNGKPAVLPESDIEALRDGLMKNAHVQPHPYLKVGRRVRVLDGPMSGIEGILTRRKDKFRVVINIELLMRSVAVEVDESDLRPV